MLMMNLSICKIMMLNLYIGIIKVNIEENFLDMKFLNNFFW